jgi:regulator of protease activity HflC (stomatin/prohibitin superfamily)
MDNGIKKRDYEEKIFKAKNGYVMLFSIIACFLLSVGLVIGGAAAMPQWSGAAGVAVFVVGLVLVCVDPILLAGLKIVNPNEAIVLLLFGRYKGTILDEGFFWVNPLCVSYNPGAKSMLTAAATGKTAAAAGLLNRKLSLKAMTLNNDKQKVNDEDGNPIEIGVVVIWKIVNTAKAVFNVENYAEFISTQADSAIRQVARLYPYDVSADGDEKSLRGSSQEIAETLRQELQKRVAIAGIEIMEARIAHLAYAPEIAAAMLQRQQAGAIIAARKMIVEGAVGMVEMALEKLSENNVVTLDDERKATMVSNLLVVLCGNRDAQPVVNSGSLY